MSIGSIISLNTVLNTLRRSRNDDFEHQRREFDQRAKKLREDHDRERAVKSRQRRAIPSYDWNGQGS